MVIKRDDLMEGIKGIYIINQRGTSVFSYDPFKQKDQELNYSLLANLFSALKNFNLKTGENGINSLRMKEQCFFFIKDDFTGNFIVAKCSPQIKSKEMSNILLEIKFEFIKKYMKEMYSDNLIKKNLNLKFRDTIHEILKEETKRKEMINSMGLKNF
ncbi:MAG: hypothetical protein ACQERB_04005 [Promethearchaeati archaeon]